MDSYVLETDVHFPTDLNLLWDAGRKCVDLVEGLLASGYDLPGWRKFRAWRRQLKACERTASQIVYRGGPNKEARVKAAVREQGLLTIQEMARLLDCPTKLVYHWRYLGLIEGVMVNDLGERLYKRPSEYIINEIKSRQRRRLWDPACLKEQPQGAV